VDVSGIGKSRLSSTGRATGGSGLVLNRPPTDALGALGLREAEAGQHCSLSRKKEP
jgi:hypothetical protein